MAYKRNMKVFVVGICYKGAYVFKESIVPFPMNWTSALTNSL